MGRMIDSDKLHFKHVKILTRNGEVKRSIVVFAKEIERERRKEQKQ